MTLSTLQLQILWHWLEQTNKHRWVTAGWQAVFMIDIVSGWIITCGWSNNISTFGCRFSMSGLIFPQSTKTSADSVCAFSHVCLRIGAMSNKSDWYLAKWAWQMLFWWDVPGNLVPSLCGGLNVRNTKADCLCRWDDRGIGLSNIFHLTIGVRSYLQAIALSMHSYCQLHQTNL